MICFNSWEYDIVRLLYATVHSGTKGQPGVPEAPPNCPTPKTCAAAILHVTNRYFTSSSSP